MPLPDIDESAVCQPLAVFAVVTPFNFPDMIQFYTDKTVYIERWPDD